MRLSFKKIRSSLNSPNFKILKFIIVIYLSWSIIIYSAGYFSLSIFPSLLPTGNIGRADLDLSYFSKWAYWDGGHFRGIAQVGYKQSQTAFFPLYPLLIKLLLILGIDSLTGALLISFFSTFIGLFFLYKLLKLDFNESTTNRNLFFILIYPTSFIFLAAYSEGLFFALSTSAFYFARIKKWKTSYLLAGLSSLTRLIGIAVIIVLFTERFLNKDKRNLFNINLKSFLEFSISFIPLILYSVYLNFLGRGYLSFIFDELYWGRKPTLFWETIVNSLTLINKRVNNIQDFLIFISSLFLVILISVFALFYKKMRKSYRIYYLLSIIIPLSSGVATGIHRYSLVIFPFFIALGLVKNRFVNFIWIIFSLVLLLMLLALYINGFPID